MERHYDELNDNFAIQFQALNRTFDVQFDRLHSILDSSTLANDLKFCHLQTNVENLNHNFSNRLGTCSKTNASPIVLLVAYY